MSKGTILENEFVEGVLQQLIAEITRKYKIDADSAYEVVAEMALKDPKLIEVFEQNLSEKQLYKTKAFKNFKSKVKTTIYYQLRKYNENADEQRLLIEKLNATGPDTPDSWQALVNELLAMHISTKERTSDASEFYAKLAPHLKSAQSIVDIGCGIHPLMFPYQEITPALNYYLALDKDRLSLEVLDAYARHYDFLEARLWNITEGWSMLAEHKVNEFDWAFLFKVVPVVNRIDKEALNVLMETPARRWIISGARYSMTKYVSIEKRERKVINEFVEKAGRRVVDEFIMENEFYIFAE